MKPLIALLLAASISGCATMETVEHSQTTHQTFYSGTRLNLAALTDDYESLSVFAKRGAQPLEYPIVDLPFSLVGDTLMLTLVYGRCLGGFVCESVHVPYP